MPGIVRTLVDDALRPVRHKASLVAEQAAEMTVAVIVGLVAVGFGVAAATIWLSRMWGPVVACLVMAGLFLAVAVVALVLRSSAPARHRKREREEERRRRETGGTALDMAKAMATTALISGGSQPRRALAMGRTVARKINPWMLVVAAVAGGYLASRSMDRTERDEGY